MQISLSLLQVILSVLALALAAAVFAIVIKNNRWLKKQVTDIEKKCQDIEEREHIREDFTMELIDKVAKVEKAQGNGHTAVPVRRTRSGKFTRKSEVKS